MNSIMEKDKRKNRFHIWGNDFYKGILEIKVLKIFALKPVPHASPKVCFVNREKKTHDFFHVPIDHKSDDLLSVTKY